MQARTLWILTALLATGCTTDTQEIANQDVTNRDIARIVSSAVQVDGSQQPIDRLVEALSAGGYIVQPGPIVFGEQCQNPPLCYGNNPSTRYGQPRLPPHPSKDGDGFPMFHLSPSEAVLFVGRTPPPVHYFGFQSYLYARTDFAGTYRDIFASLGDAINPMTIKTFDGEAHDRLVCVIATADKLTAQHVIKNLGALFAQVLGEKGVPDSDTVGPQLAASLTNVEPLPRDALRMGIADGTDIFNTLLRVTPITAEEDQQAADKAAAYMKQPPALALRVTPTKMRAGLPHFFIKKEVDAALRQKKLGADPCYECTLLAPVDPAPEATLDSIVARLQQTHAVTHRSTTARLTPARWAEGRICIARFEYFNDHEMTDALAAGPWCAGDTRDTSYVVQSESTPLDPEDFIYVVGVNHEATGMATYMNVSANDRDNSQGLDSLVNAQLVGSADGYVPSAREPYYYVVKIARDCNDEDYCVAVKEEVLAGHAIAAAERAYLNPKTAVGSSYDDLVIARVVRFTKR